MHGFYCNLPTANLKYYLGGSTLSVVDVFTLYQPAIEYRSRLARITSCGKSSLRNTTTVPATGVTLKTLVEAKLREFVDEGIVVEEVKE